MPRLEVNPISSDIENSNLYKHKSVRLGSSIRIETPTFAFDPSILRNYDNVNPEVRGYNEIYLTLQTKNNPVSNYLTSAEKTDAFNSRIDARLNKTSPDEITSCYVDWKDSRYPDDYELEFLVNTSYKFGDLSALPLMPELTNNIESRPSFDRYFNLIKKGVELLRQLNNKPIIGVIPRLGSLYTSKLVEYYINNDINAFAFDLDRRNSSTMTQYMLSAYRKLKDYEMLDHGFINVLNSGSGRFLKNSNVVEAKDVISFGFGFDSFSRNHRPPKLPSRIWTTMDRSENKLRMFNKEDYGYYKIDPQNVSTIYQNDSSIPENNLLHGSNSMIKRLEKLYNNEQLAIESTNLRDVVDQEPTESYLNEKEYTKKEDIKSMRQFKDHVNQPDISRLFG